MKLNRSVIALVAIISIIVLIFFYSGTLYDIRCIFAEHFGFKRVGPNIFVQNDMPATDVQVYLLTIEKSKQRVINLFGAIECTPIIILGTNQNGLQKFGGLNQYGSTRRDILGTFVVIGVHGLNEDVIAHELVHSELEKRIGWYRLFRIPMWFDEGLAIQVDSRPMYSEEVWKQKTNNGQDVPALDTLTAANQFYTGDKRLHYIVAKHEVMEWLKKAEQEGLLELIDKIKNGEDFYKAYELIQQS